MRWFLLMCWVCFVPAALWAQPFDVARVRRSVVQVIPNRGGPGSGSIIQVEGSTAYILTAHHVIKEDVNNDVFHVRVELFTEESLDARVLRDCINETNDIAILTVHNLPSPPPPAIPWESSVAVSDMQLVRALGHPTGGPRWAVTDGTVSRILGGKIYFSGTAVEPGNSGGPLLNAEGAFVGMNVMEGGRLGVALMADVIRPLIRGCVPAQPITSLRGPIDVETSSICSHSRRLNTSDFEFTFFPEAVKPGEPICITASKPGVASVFFQGKPLDIVARPNKLQLVVRIPDTTLLDGYLIVEWKGLPPRESPQLLVIKSQ